MGIQRLNLALKRDLEELTMSGRSKPEERIIERYIPTDGVKGPRYIVKDSELEFIKMNANNYLGLANHPALLEAADRATKELGVGPGSVRFIDGTTKYHVQLEQKIAHFIGKPAAKIFNSAYTANCGLALTLNTPNTIWVGDELNHNSIIRAMRICGAKSENKRIYKHNDMGDLVRCLDSIPQTAERIIVIFDGVFSMRGDTAPISEIVNICRDYMGKYKDGIITVVDDSHGIGAFGNTGRGSIEYCDSALPDIIVGTLGKAFGVNGGFITTSNEIIDAVRQKADTYIYTNPLSAADCAAAVESIDICDGDAGLALLSTLKDRIKQFREGVSTLGYETIDGPHPIVPIILRDTDKVHKLTKFLFDKGILVVGLTFPVVPKGNESLRFQLCASHTEYDVGYVLAALQEAKSLL